MHSGVRLKRRKYRQQDPTDIRKRRKYPGHNQDGSFRSDRPVEPLHNLIAAEVERHAQHFATGGAEPLYLYFRRSTESAFDALRLATAQPDGFELAERRCYDGDLLADSVYVRITSAALCLRQAAARAAVKPLTTKLHRTVAVRLQAPPAIRYGGPTLIEVRIIRKTADRMRESIARRNAYRHAIAA